MKKFIAVLLVAVMCFSLGIGGTVAYLTDRETETNVFTVGNVEIELTEDFEQGIKLLPGSVVEKTSTIKNVGDNDAWVFYAYGVPEELADYVGVEFTGEKWAKNDEVKFTDDDECVYTIIALSDALEVNGESAIDFKITLDPHIDIDPDGKWHTVTANNSEQSVDIVDLGWNNSMGNPMIYVNAYAIQKEEFADVNAAIKAYAGQWGTVIKHAEAPVLVATADELKAALEAGESVALTADVTVDSTIDVPAGKDVTLNLNGNDLSYAVENDKAAAIINNKGTLEITGEGTISFVAANPDLGAIPAYATNTITNTGKLVIGEGVIVTNGSNGGASYAVDNHGEFILNGGTLIGERCALRVAKYNQDNVVFVMNGGLVKAATPAWIQLPGSDANVAPKISVTINDGIFQSTKATSADNNVLYTYSFGNSHANTSVTINGGMFLGGTVSIGSGYNKGDVPALTINGGTFEYDVLQWLENDDSKILYIANGVGTKVATSKEELTAALAEGGIVVLTEDVKLDDNTTINVDSGKKVTLDLNGNKITMEAEDPVSLITNNGDLTIEGEGKIAVTFNGTVDNNVAMNAISNRGNLTINGCTISNTGTGNQIGYAIDNYNGSTLTVNGGKITASGSSYYDGIRLFCGSNDETVVTVNGGEISSIWAQNPSANKATEVKGTVVVNGGNVATVYYKNYTTVKVADGVTTTVTPYGAGSSNTTSVSENGYTVYSFVH